MEVAALLTALVTLVAALLKLQEQRAPEREKEKLEQTYERDVSQADRAIRTHDPGALSELFEQNRQDAVERGALDPRGGGGATDADRLRDLSGAASPPGPGGGPADRPAA